MILKLQPSISLSSSLRIRVFQYLSERKKHVISLCTGNTHTYLLNLLCSFHAYTVTESFGGASKFGDSTG